MMVQRDALGNGAWASGADREALIRQVTSIIRTLVRLKYFSLEVEGVQHLPRGGPVVYAQNHAGWFALDTFVVGHVVTEALGMSRTPYFAAHESALAAPVVGPFLQRLGGLPASWFRNAERLPPEIESYGICPEGVRGNCKPFWEAYRMHEWSRTFVKLALVRSAAIVPVAVVGGEECLPVAWTVKILKPIIGSIVGLPLVPVPLPTRWKVVFHEPVRLTSSGNPLRPDRQYCTDVARRVQGIVQETLDRETRCHPLAQLSSFVSRMKEGPVQDAEDPDPLLGPEDEPSLVPGGGAGTSSPPGPGIATVAAPADGSP
jgi:1-acyl-sn-glycerol-3-phosphate acyltransferase